MIKKYSFFFFFSFLWINAQDCVQDIICSDDTIIVYKSDGSILIWGQNQYGQIGNGTVSPQTIPLQLGTIEMWQTINPGRMHTVALKEDGTIWAWGNNSVGQLGDGTEISNTTPVQVGSDSDWVSLSAGNLHSVALKSDGTFWGWGNTQASELTNGSVYFYTSPVQISPDTDWDKIYAGYFKTYGIKTNGTLWGRGRNLYGSLGVGYNGTVFMITQIGEDSDWFKVSAARSNHSLALKTNGTLWGWGENENGKLGDGTTINRYDPVQIGNDHWKDVSAGNSHSIGIKENGTLWQWGSYGWIDGQMLIPITTVPVQVGTDTDWVKVMAGYSISFALKEDNSLWGWGYNSVGWLGNGTTISSANPILLFECATMVQEAFELDDFELFPNPVESVLNWDTKFELEELEIINILGQKVNSVKLIQNQNSLDVTNLAKGAYIIIAKLSDGSVKTTKFIKK